MKRTPLQNWVNLHPPYPPTSDKICGVEKKREKEREQELKREPNTMHLSYSSREA